MNSIKKWGFSRQANLPDLKNIKCNHYLNFTGKGYVKMPTLIKHVNDIKRLTLAKSESRNPLVDLPDLTELLIVKK